MTQTLREHSSHNRFRLRFRIFLLLKHHHEICFDHSPFLRERRQPWCLTAIGWEDISVKAMHTVPRFSVFFSFFEKEGLYTRPGSEVSELSERASYFRCNETLAVRKLRCLRNSVGFSGFPWDFAWRGNGGENLFWREIADVLKLLCSRTIGSLELESRKVSSGT